MRVRETSPGEFELLHPRCALERADDLEEVREMIEEGEAEIATDEIRWLLSGCHDFIEAHRLLGELAAAADDVRLARGHFGVAFQLGQKAAAKIRGTLPYRLPGNQAFHEAGKGLVWSLLQLEKRDLAIEVAAQLRQFDPTDPLDVKALFSSPAEPTNVVQIGITPRRSS